MSRSFFHRWLLVLCLAGLAVAVFVPMGRGQELEWRGFEEAMAVADSTNRFVMVAVDAPWCGWCRKMKAEVYPSTGVRRCLADDFVVTRLNRDDTESTYRYQGRRMTPRELASRFRADGVPATVVLSPQGEYVLHLSGFIEPAPLQLMLAYVGTRAYRHTSVQAFRADPAGCGRALGTGASSD
jgi:thioredoxin-related protein